MHVLMVDDHPSFLDGLKLLLGVMAPELGVETATNLGEASRKLQQSNFDLVLLDWHLVDIDGDQAMEQLREQGCSAPIVVLSGETNTRLIHRAIEMGAAGFIPKRYTSEMMVSALDQVLAGRVFLPTEDVPSSPARATPAPFDEDQRLSALTPRQIAVYRAAARGLPNKLIARELGVEPSTVKSHLSAVYAALGVRNRTEAAYQASREGTQLFQPLRK